MDFPYFEGGRFYVGCNYWASHAGTYMWRNWRPDVVKQDFELMAKAGLRLVRMFPLWPDFQPLEQMYGGGGTRCEYSLKGHPLPDTWEGQCGVDVEALDKFAYLLECAEQNCIKLMVGLVTGWMSGRLFAPPAFEGRNLLTDSEVIKWQVRMVRCIVRRFKEAPAIVAWDLGNECNCMASLASDADAWCWNNAIASAIRLEDSTRPVVSGMHGLSCDDHRNWRPWDVGELNDILNTHPYPIFTPYSGLQRVNTLRNAMHAAAESRLYAEVGGKPCTVEEAGNLGPMYSSPQTASAYLNNMLWNAYAHDCRSLLWWCGFDQTQLPFPPYEWNAMERELGLFDADKKETLPLKTLGAFQRTIDSLAITLPKYRRNAVCILSQGQDTWGVAFASFILAKQAGFDIEFQYAKQPLKEADAYILPSIATDTAIYQYRYKELLAKVEAGASLFVTWAGGGLQPFEKVFGARPEWRYQEAAPRSVTLEGTSITLTQSLRMGLSAPNAAVCATDEKGMPVLTLGRYGKGQVAFLASGIENELAPKPKAFLPEATPAWRFYAWFAKVAGIQRILRSNDPFITCTEHFIDAKHAYVIAVNNTPEARAFSPSLAPGWTIVKPLVGSLDGVPANSAIILELLLQKN